MLLEGFAFIAILLLIIFGHIIDSHLRAKYEWDEILKSHNEKSTRKRLPYFNDEQIMWCLEDSARFLGIDVNDLLTK